MDYSTIANQRPAQRRQHSKIAAGARPLLAITLLALSVTPLFGEDRPAVRKVPPVYPPIARQMGITGVVMVSATVDPTGKVVKAESTSDNKILAPAAIDAVRQWKFAPGDATETVTVAVSFEHN